MVQRIPLDKEAFTGRDAVLQYDRGARLYIMPEYKYFVRKILGRGIRKGRILDIGTGSGRLAIELARTRGCDFDIVALDNSPDMLRRARENTARAGVNERIRFVLATASRLPFPNGYFDLVISYASLHHWLKPVQVLNEAQRVTGTEGTIIIRDNQRVFGNPFWETFIWAISRFMNKRHRDNWPKAILASYTVSEIKVIVGQSNMPDCRVYTDFIKFDMCIETIKRQNNTAMLNRRSP